MKHAFTLLLAAASLLAAVGAARAQVPQLLNYQGRLVANGTNFTGTGRFKFALLNGAGNLAFWNNDGSAVGGTEPANPVLLPVVNGLYSVLLGDTNLGMVPIPHTVFTNSDVRLRVWFNDGITGSQLLAPDQRIAAVGYAMMAAAVPDRSITSAKLGLGAVTATNLANGSVTAAKLAPGAAAGALGNDVDIGTNNVCGRLDVYRTSVGSPAVTIDGCTSQISAFVQHNGAEAVEILATSSGGQVSLRDELNNLTFRATSPSTGGGTLDIYNSLFRQTVSLDGSDPVTGGGRVQVANLDGDLRADLGISTTTRGAFFNLSDSNGTPTIQLTGADNVATGGRIQLFRGNGTLTVDISGDRTNNSGAGYIGIYNGSGVRTAYIVGEDGTGSSRIRTEILEITGGSDLSENFDLSTGSAEAQAGMLVCIDAATPGQLRPSCAAYDKTVAGILSGAGGVRTGMLMGQQGTKADGKHPVALTGRVYCLVDADRGAIEPGDLITTSDTPGHGMKVADPARAQGAIVGKAMTALARGKGLVLVLVSLQ